MTNQRSTQTYEVTWLIRRLFRAMSQEADVYLGRFGLTAADRAVMEFLYPDEQLTVPAIAKRYDVSRQHVQTVVNGLLENDLLRSQPNPQHKRSALLQLNQRGRERFAAIRDSESAIVKRLFTKVADRDVVTTRNTLKKMLEQLA